VSGYAVDRAFERVNAAAKLQAMAGVLVIGALGFSAYQTIDLNFFHYDDDRYAYVNAHTRREFISLVVTINQIAQRAGTGTETTIAVTSPEYWPLPWYLRGYRRVGYFGGIPESRDAIVIGSETQDTELRAALGDAYERMGPFVLRPGVNLLLYARREVLR
jgi:predicted membrane-bound mannosyltransferase